MLHYSVGKDLRSPPNRTNSHSYCVPGALAFNHAELNIIQWKLRSCGCCTSLAGEVGSQPLIGVAFANSHLIAKYYGAAVQVLKVQVGLLCDEISLYI